MNNPIDKYVLNYKFSPLLACFVTALAFISWIILSSEDMLLFVEEHGIVESGTVIFYFVALIVVWLPKSIAVSDRYTRTAGTIILLAMAAREADLHKYISGISMFKLRFWTGHYPIGEKLLSALVIFPIAMAVLYIFIKFFKSCLAGFKARQADAMSVVTFFVVMIISKIIDRSLNAIHEVIGWVAPRWMVALQNALEEYLEFLLPILVIIFIYQYIRINQFNDMRSG
jgi:hypothetical protein